MTYYDTIEEDIERAKEIIAKGKLSEEEIKKWPPGLRAAARENNGAIYGADTYAAYKLLESFVEEIERLHREKNAVLQWRAGESQE